MKVIVSATCAFIMRFSAIVKWSASTHLSLALSNHTKAQLCSGVGIFMVKLMNPLLKALALWRAETSL
jgi:hypothetical protein